MSEMHDCQKQFQMYYAGDLATLKCAHLPARVPRKHATAAAEDGDASPVADPDFDPDVDPELQDPLLGGTDQLVGNDHLSSSPPPPSSSSRPQQDQANSAETPTSNQAKNSNANIGDSSFKPSNRGNSQYGMCVKAGLGLFLPLYI